MKPTSKILTPAGASGRVRAASPAAAAIAAAKSEARRPSDPSPEGVAALRELCAHNDACPTQTGRVSRAAALAMLRDSYGWGYAISVFDDMCVRVLGRKSWGQP